MRQYCKWTSSSVYPDMKKLREVLTQLSDQQKLHTLQQKYSICWETPLYCAAGSDDKEIIGTLLTSLQSSGDRLKLLMVSKFTPLHLAAFSGHTESAKTILDCLTADHQIHLMSAQSILDETVIQYAERRGHTDTARVLTEYQHRAEQIQQQQEQRRLYQYRKSLSGEVMSEPP